MVSRRWYSIRPFWGLAWALLCGCQPAGPEPLVVYCSHDAVFAQEHFDRFTTETGIPVSIKYDTEANKSLGLANLLLSEQDQPRCDVFWNNQVSSTLDLQAAGILEPYKGSGFERIPDQFKDPQGYWTGFAARLRVYIINTDHISATEEAVNARMAGDLSRVTIAKPIYGTTRTHYTVLWHLLGRDAVTEWHQEVLNRNVKVANGNAQVKDLVASGSCDLGWTDTDDFFVAKDEGKPVAMLPIRVGDAGKTILIPNSVCLIKGARHPEAARKFIDFLLSQESEVALSKSAARQIPLGPVPEELLSPEVRQLREWGQDGYDMTVLGEATAECLAWLRAEYLK